MNWLFYAALAVLFGTLREVSQKYALQGETTLEYLVIRSAFISILSLAALPWVSFQASWQGYVLSVFVGVLASVAVLKRNTALKHADISSIQPLSNFLPLFVAVIAYAFLGEAMTILQWGGVALIVSGSYVLQLPRKKSDVLAPLESLVTSRYLRLTLGAVVILAVTTTLDRYVLTTYMDVVTYFFITWNAMGATLVAWHGYKHQFRNVISVFKKEWQRILVPSVLTVLIMLPLYTALSMAYAGLVAAVYRLKSVSTTLHGGWFFHEEGVARKTVACGIMVVGAALVLV